MVRLEYIGEGIEKFFFFMNLMYLLGFYIFYELK